MKPIALEWVAKAEGDFSIVEREARARKHPNREPFRDHLIFLTGFAMSFRFPGESADRYTALDARKRCCHFRRAAREARGLQITS